MAGIFSLAFAILPVMAQASLPFGECRAGYWSSSRNLDDHGGGPKSTCFLTWRSTLSPLLSVGTSGRLGWADAQERKDFQGRLREGFVQVEQGGWTVRGGRQIIAWGRADRLNPTDYFSPRDLTLLVPEDDEQRNGINALLLRFQASKNISFTAVTSQFEPNLIPQGLLPKNLIQADRSGHGELGLKIDFSGERFDGSLSYFNGFDRMPRYWAESTIPAAPVFHGFFEKLQTIGADFSTARESWTMRGEATISRGESNSIISRAVLGVDRDFLETANINLQLFRVSRSGYMDPQSVNSRERLILMTLDRLNMQFGPEDLGMTFKVSNRMLNERLRLEIGAMVDFTNRSNVLRPRVFYTLNDKFKIAMGFDYFSGRQQSIFGALQKNNLIFFEVSIVC